MYNVKAALASGAFEKVVVSSDDDEILEIAVKAGAVPTKECGVGQGHGLLGSGLFDYVDTVPELVSCALVQCTSPLTTADDFRNGVMKFLSPERTRS